jgi:RNA polymerase sigma factor (sigma-70 family)
MDGGNWGLLDEKNGNKSGSNVLSKKASSRVLESFLHNRSALRSFISQFVLPTSDIDDISQEAFLRAYKTELKRPIDHPKAFLFRIARNLALTERSKKSSKITDYIEDFEYEEILMEDESLEDNIMAQQKLGIFCEAVATLTPQCRRTFLLKRVYEMSNKDIAKKMDIAVSTVEKHLSRALRHCHSVIKERYGEQELKRPAHIQNEPPGSERAGL